MIASSENLEPDTLGIVIQKFGSIDDFEEYGSDGDLRAAWTVRQGTAAAAFLETAVPGEGRNAMRMEYTLGGGSPSYAGLSRPLTGDLSRIGALRFWLKPDGSGRTLHIRLQETDTKYWYADRVLNGTDPETATIPLEAFAPNVGTARPNTAALTRIGLNVTIGNAGSGSGSLVFDDMKFLAAASAVRNPAPPEVEPAGFSVGPAYPNPFNTATGFEIRLPEGGDLAMTVFDPLGREIEAWTVPNLPAGPHRIRWVADGLASGVYVLRAESGGFSRARKCVLMR
ncbi:MAG: carbohydrate binding domain-containing protein [bacterium]|nr:carbohydrate binding domain-containing protein [bacterium]